MQTAHKTEMTIPPELLGLVEQLTDELDRTEQQANKGLALASQLLERFPNNARLIGLSANLANVLFFVSSFRNRIKSRIGEISGSNVSIDTIQDTGEELSEFWGRIQECKMTVSRCRYLGAFAMNEPQMTKEQEDLLDEAVKYSQLAEQQARELWELGEVFAAKWEKRLRDAEVTIVPKLGD